MKEHISFEDMSRVVLATEVTEELIALSAKVDAHLLHCAKCLSAYRALMQADDAIAELKQTGTGSTRGGRVRFASMNAISRLSDEAVKKYPFAKKEMPKRPVKKGPDLSRS